MLSIVHYGIYLPIRRKSLLFPIRTARHSKPLWDSLQTILNELSTDVLVNDREGRILIAVDDDKFWFGPKVSGINLVMFICLPSPDLLIYAVRKNP